MRSFARGFALSALFFALAAPAVADEAPAAREVFARAAETARLAAAGDALKIEGVQARFDFDLELGARVYESVRAAMSGVFNRDFAPRLKGAGSFKAVFDGAGARPAARRFSLELSSDQFAFFMVRDGNDLTLFSPQLNYLVRDDFDRFAGAVREGRSAVPALPEIDLSRLAGRDVSALLAALSDILDQAGRRVDPAEKAGSLAVRGRACRRVSFPGDRGQTLTLDLYADTWAPAALRVVSPAGDLTADFDFDAAADTVVTADHYLPSAFTVSGRRDGSRVDFKVTRIRYNPFLGDDDFTLREANLAEFLGMVYLRAFTGGGW